MSLAHCRKCGRGHSEWPCPACDADDELPPVIGERFRDAFDRIFRHAAEGEDG